MTESQVRSVAVFFYYVLPHELLAMEATDKALRKIKKEKAKSEEYTDVLIIRNCNSIASKYLKEYRSGKNNLEKHNFPKAYEKIEEPLIKPSSLSVGPWRQMLKDSNPEDLFLLVWAHVLEFSMDYIVLASGLSKGTVYHRLSYSVDQLGNYLQPGSQSWGSNA